MEKTKTAIAVGIMTTLVMMIGSALVFAPRNPPPEPQKIVDSGDLQIFPGDFLPGPNMTEDYRPPTDVTEEDFAPFDPIMEDTQPKTIILPDPTLPVEPDFGPEKEIKIFETPAVVPPKKAETKKSVKPVKNIPRAKKAIKYAKKRSNPSIFSSIESLPFGGQVFHGLFAWDQDRSIWTHRHR